jgi:hypothetical protein
LGDRGRPVDAVQELRSRDRRNADGFGGVRAEGFVEIELL